MAYTEYSDETSPQTAVKSSTANIPLESNLWEKWIDPTEKLKNGLNYGYDRSDLNRIALFQQKDKG